MDHYDFIVIGGGIAGISVAAELSTQVSADGSVSADDSVKASVLVLEQEQHPGYHATGRSAAVYAPAYGSDKPSLFALSKASGPFFENPPRNFCDNPLLHPRNLLFIAHKDKKKALETEFEGLRQANPNLRLVNQEFIKAKLPALHPDYTELAIYDDSVCDVDVNELQEGYLKLLRRNGGVLKTGHCVEQITRENNHWVVHCSAGTFKASTIINAAGAWADNVANLAGVKPIGLRPLRRTAILIDPPKGTALDSWPMVVEFEQGFYIKPDAGKVLISPADETLSEPCDAQPEEIDIAYAAHHAETVLNLVVQKVEHSWAGLRSFVDDGNIVMGYSTDCESFFWLAGQGGYGIQTAPAASRTAAALALRKPVPKDIAELGFNKMSVSPQRLKT